jgi:hypothetical protein
MKTFNQFLIDSKVTIKPDFEVTIKPDTKKQKLVKPATFAQSTLMSPILNSYEYPKKKKSIPKVPDTGSDARGDQCIAGMTGALSETEALEYPISTDTGTAFLGSTAQKVSSSSPSDSRSDQDKKATFDRLKTIVKSKKLRVPPMIDNS